MKPYLALILLGSSLIGLSACNTVEGFGKDLEKAGRTVSGGAADGS